MLTELYVKNFALIKELKLEFEPGLTVISGETGAGKSLLVGALGLLAGGRVSPATMIRTGETDAAIEGVFEIGGLASLAEYLEDAGLMEGDTLIIRRDFGSRGRSRVYINGHTVPLSQLEGIAPFLVDLSGQHEGQSLLDNARHLTLLDEACALKDTGFAAAKKSYQEAFGRTTQLSSEIIELERRNTERASRMEFIRFQLQEIEKAGLGDEDEEDALEAEKKRVKNADALFELADSGEGLLGYDIPALHQLWQRVRKLMDQDAELTQGDTLLNEALIALVELQEFFSRYKGALEVKPGRLEEIESRLYAIHQLKLKYGASISEIKAKAQSFMQELSQWENYDEVIAGKRREFEEYAGQTVRLVLELSAKRKKHARLFESAIHDELKGLSMPHVQFVIALTHRGEGLSQCDSQGADRVLFQFSANLGEDLKPLSEVASGGELSRILLAVKIVMNQADDRKTCLFDEVDSGIGSAVGEMVGLKLKELSRHHQVLCVTHLPQIASLANHHFVIEKIMEDDRTHTQVRGLATLAMREQEIARMLGGTTVTDKTRAHAKEMIGMGNTKGKV